MGLVMLSSRIPVVFLATSNIHKFNEARYILREYDLATAVLKKIKAVEIQTDSIEEVAKASAVDAFQKCGLPVAVEDAGLFVKALGDFPGPYSSYVYRTIGSTGVLKLMRGVVNRKAHFKSVVAYMGHGMNEPKCFIGKVEGRISKEKLGSQGFGFDPIFKAFNSHKTFGQMALKEKSTHSHRAKAFRKFARWYTTQIRIHLISKNFNIADASLNEPSED